jgi:glutathione S-transferase
MLAAPAADPTMKLVIANKTYSSWSMRPWLALKAAGIPFEEQVIYLRHDDTSARIRAVSPNGKVPALIDGETVVFESIAILDYLAERAPELWPSQPAPRAHARSISAEMHAGFQALRSRCPMNLKRKPAPLAIGPEVEADVRRIVTLWADCRERFGAGGEFLFGRFTNADAMYAPVVNRFEAYAIPVPAEARRYMAAVQATPMWQEWHRGAMAETEAIHAYDTLA